MLALLGGIAIDSMAPGVVGFLVIMLSLLAGMALGEQIAQDETFARSEDGCLLVR